MPSASSLQSFGRLDVGDVIYERLSRLKPEHTLGQTRRRERSLQIALSRLDKSSRMRREIISARSDTGFNRNRC